MSDWTGEPLSNQVYRIHQLRNDIRNRLINLGLLENTSQYEQEQVADRSGEAGATLDECATAIEGMGGRINVTNRSRINVAGKEVAQIVDRNLVASNIRSGKTILGVPGTYSGTTYQLPLTNSYTWSYGGPNAPTTINHPSDSSGYKMVYTQLSTANTKTLIPRNIVKGVTIMGVTGEYDMNAMYAAHTTNRTTSGLQHSKKITFDVQWTPDSSLSGSVRYNQMPPANKIQLGWCFAFDSDNYDECQWNPPDRSDYFIYRVTFGLNRYENSTPFLSVDVMKRSLLSSDEIYHLRVKGNDPGYSIVANGDYARVEIDLTNKTFAYANYHEEIGSDFSESNDVIFDRSSNGVYHIDIRW